jgi:hypothetical protein
VTKAQFIVLSQNRGCDLGQLRERSNPINLPSQTKDIDAGEQRSTERACPDSSASAQMFAAGSLNRIKILRQLKKAGRS